MHFLAKASLIAVLLASFAVAPATAQENSTSSNTTESPSATYISEDVKLVNSGYDGDTEQAFVELRSTETVEVTVSDGGALSDGGGEIPARTITLPSNQTVRVELPATKVNGRVALVISTPQVLYGHIIENSNSLVGPGGFTARDAQITGASGALVVAIISLVMVVRYLAGTTDAPERIA